jgi:hypothetical protein
MAHEIDKLKGKIRITRRNVKGIFVTAPDFENMNMSLTKWYYVSSLLFRGIIFRSVDNAKSIEDYESTLQVDFANKYIGGGVLHGVS